MNATPFDRDSLLTLPRHGTKAELPPMPDVELRQLHHLAVLAQCDSISSAASHLGIAQPSLSELLARMEARVGVQLVIRQGRGIQMTEAGLALARRAHDLLVNVSEAVEQSRALDETSVGSITLGIPPSLGMILSVALAETVQAELPGVKLRIVEALSGDIADWVTLGRLDFGCVLGSGPPSILVYKPIATERLFLVTAPDNWQGEFDKHGVACEPIQLSKIEQYEMSLPSAPHGARRELDQALRAVGGRLSVGMEIDSLTQIVALVDRASTYGLLPRAAVLDRVEAGRIALVPTEPRLERTINLVRDRDRPVSRVGRAVEELVRLILREAIERHGLQSSMQMI